MNMSLRKALPGNFDTEGSVEITTNKPLNINLSYGVTHVIKKTMKNIMRPVKHIEEIKTDKRPQEKFDEEEVMEFINNLGVPMQVAVEGFMEDPKKFRGSFTSEGTIP